jgi:hypothetical protein
MYQYSNVYSRGYSDLHADNSGSYCHSEPFGLTSNPYSYSKSDRYF